MEIKDDRIFIYILQLYGLDRSAFLIERIGTGHIHQTYRLNGKKSYVLQRVNKNVFKYPEVIASNLRQAGKYLAAHFPEYLFLNSIPSLRKEEMAYDQEGFPWRLFPYFENTITVDKVDNAEEAFSAAREFARLTRYLDGIDVHQFEETIPQFHDLALRYQQFETALSEASSDCIQMAQDCIDACQKANQLVDVYKQLIQNKSLKLRVTHNDTKINNVLFDKTTRQATCVIDLDTLMPGYFIYDLGDMVRTFVCPVSEEEPDRSKVVFRKEIYEATLNGYLSQMEEVMSPAEMAAIPLAGKIMTYIMALRFLADFLRGDTYYHTTYPGQNLVRARNQLTFLEKLQIL